MKKLITACAVLVLAVTDMAAQGISAGLRTGTSCWMQRTTEKSGPLEATPAQHRSWDQEVFVRWERPGRWAFEAGFSHASVKKSEILSVTGDDFPYNTEYFQNIRPGHNYDLSLSAQYDITCAHMKACPLLRRLRSYVGVSIIPTVTTLRPGLDPTPDEQTVFQTWTGLSHTMVYNVTQHLAVSTAVEGRFAPTELFSGSFNAGEYRPAARMGVRLGVAYRFSGRPAPSAAPAH